MDDKRWQELMQPFNGDESITLTPEELQEGWHWCEEWDGLLIHPDDAEFRSCACSWMDKYRTPERMERHKRQEALDRISALDDDMGRNPGQENQ
jgi:hypothetical protein